MLHDETKPPATLVQNYPRGSKELLGPFTSRFGASEAAAWFRSKGVKLKTESDGRMFPTTDKSETIAGCLLQSAAKAGVEIRTRTQVVNVERRGEQLVVVAKTSDGRTWEEETDLLLLSPGSSPAAWEWVRGLGHRISDPCPSLFTFVAGEGDGWLTELAGVSVQLASIRVVAFHAARGLEDVEAEQGVGEGVSQTPCDKSPAVPAPPSPERRPPHGPSSSLRDKPRKVSKRKLATVQEGPVLLTHKGLSGPAVLRLSAFLAPEFAECGYEATVELNLCHPCNKGEVTQALQQCRKRLSPKLISTQCPLGAFLPVLGASQEGEGTPRISRRLWAALLAQRTSVPTDLRWADLSNDGLAQLAEALCECQVRVSGRGMYKDEFVTCGGVDLRDVDLRTMESRSVRGLYFAGEVLNIDGVTGGFNFQSCWTTGFLAGSAMAAERNRE